MITTRDWVAVTVFELHEEKKSMGNMSPKTISTSFVSNLFDHALCGKLQDFKSYLAPIIETLTSMPNKEKNSQRLIHLAKSNIHRIIRQPPTPVATTSKLYLFDMYATFFLDESPSEPPQIVVLHGGPGTGKSRLCDAITRAAEASGQLVLKTAFNAISATEMGGDVTCFVATVDAGTYRDRMGRFTPAFIKELR